jgi:hypothetical protein
MTCTISAESWGSLAWEFPGGHDAHVVGVGQADVHEPPPGCCLCRAVVALGLVNAKVRQPVEIADPCALRVLCVYPIEYAGGTHRIGDRTDRVRGQNAVTNRRSNRRASAAFLRSAIACAEYPPCFQLAFRLRSSPSGVRGPVLFPPCIRQRPLGIAGALQGLPVRLECAPHRGAARANSRRASRLSACGSLAIFAISPSRFQCHPPPPLLPIFAATTAWPPSPTCTC